MTAFRLVAPFWLLLLPVAIAAIWWAYHPRQRGAAMFSSVAGLKALPVTLAQRARRLLPVVYGLGLALLIVALARPQQGKSESRRHTEGIGIEMVIDVSYSMEALDFRLKNEKTGNEEQTSRVKAVQHVIREFIQGSPQSGLAGRPSDLIGLVAFGGYADSKCPLTLDHGALTEIVKALDIPKPIRDRNGNVINAEELNTAIGDGISVAVDRLKTTDTKSKVIILLTDGDSNTGVVDPRDAAEIAKTFGIKVYTIGIGTNGIVPFPVEDAFGNRVLTQQVFPIDEELLRDIAKITGAKYFHARDINALTQVYADIDKLEKSKVESSVYTEFQELYQWPALAGLALLLGVTVLNMTRFRTLP